MSALAALVRAYGRMEGRGEVPPFGYSTERIGFVVSLGEDGAPAGRPTDLRQSDGRRLLAPLLAVPRPEKRTSGLAANFLWDKTAYALGVTARTGPRTEKEHACFARRHIEVLAESADPGLQALRRFLEHWRPEQFDGLGWPEEMKDQNVVFALESERRERLIHERPAARALWARAIAAEDDRSEAVCLVTGERGPIARLHPSVKGVWGAQTAGASIVSFNLDAFASYGHEQGENAPVCEAAAFAYTTVLNRFLERGSGHRIQIGDASTVFWADASKATLVDEAEALFGALLDERGLDEAKQAGKLRPTLERIRAGRPIAEAAPQLAEGVRFYVLGLSPNAARLSVRFWLEDDFGVLAERFARHLRAMRLEPPPKDESPSIWRCLIETAAQRKTENIPPKLAGEWLRAILTGNAYPLTLLATLLMRLRADKEVNALRVAILKAVLVTRGREVPVTLDPHNKNAGYLLGRLFAAYEYTQTQALGPAINASIRDKYYGTASATPRAVFPLLQRTATHHLARLRKDRPGRARWLDEQFAKIFDLADPEALFVPTLTAQHQALFAVGYYHQKSDFYRRREAASAEDEATPTEGEPA
ncbi:MAG: type I-C CRISPR-associated protein Cas8c/Csd1 [Dehalococcoidia bacterium]